MTSEENQKQSVPLEERPAESTEQPKEEVEPQKKEDAQIDTETSKDVPTEVTKDEPTAITTKEGEAEELKNNKEEESKKEEDKKEEIKEEGKGKEVKTGEDETKVQEEEAQQNEGEENKDIQQSELPSNECTKSFTEEEVSLVQSLWDKLPSVFEKAGLSSSVPIETETASAPRRSVKIWKVDLDLDNPTAEARVVLVKFIRARNQDLDAASEMLANTLKWRAEFKPELASTEEFPKDLFNDIGFIHGTTKNNEPVTYNLYGAIKDQAAVFGDVDRFLRWRVGLMERAVEQLDFKSVESMVQVHDYSGVSLLAGRSKEAKEAAKQASALFSDHYPELLSTKWFINVPAVMTWIFGAFKLFLSTQTIAKFRVVGCSPAEIHDALGSVIDDDKLPKRYGGNSQSQADE